VLDVDVDVLVVCCVQGYDNSESSVRKAAVFCLVAVYLVIGEDLRPHLAPLSTSKVHAVCLTDTLPAEQTSPRTFLTADTELISLGYPLIRDMKWQGCVESDIGYIA